DAAFWIAEACRALIELQARDPGKVHWIRQDGDREAAASRLSMVLGVDLKAELLAPPAPRPGEPRFEPGHWRHYREAFAHEFKVLEPAVHALGYPVEQDRNVPAAAAAGRQSQQQRRAQADAVPGEGREAVRADVAQQPAHGGEARHRRGNEGQRHT